MSIHADYFCARSDQARATPSRGYLIKDEYDFCKGECGKFYLFNTTLNLPEYLDADVLDYLCAKANAKGVEVNDMVNDLLRKDIDLIVGMK